MLLSKTVGRKFGGAVRFALIVLLALVLALMLLPLAPGDAYAVTSAEKQAEADELVKQIDALQTELNEAHRKLGEAVSAEAAAVQLKDEAAAREEAAVQRTAELQKQLGDRAVETYRNGSVSYLDVLFGAHSFTEFVTSWEMIARINDRDVQLTEESRAARREAEDARQLYSEQERIATQKKNEIAELEASLEQKNADMQAELEKMNDEIAELLAQEEAAAEAARIAAAAAAAAQGGNGGVSVSPEFVRKLGEFVHPCPAGYVSSSFGWRNFDMSYHKGIDLAAGDGTPIYAVKDGTVTVSGYSGSAGYWVAIAHGNGLVTKYMHAYTQPYVSVGQQVSAGQVIAGVGNTGNSFGAHLHFQLEINGVAVDPYPFIYG